MSNNKKRISWNGSIVMMMVQMDGTHLIINGEKGNKEKKRKEKKQRTKIKGRQTDRTLMQPIWGRGETLREFALPIHSPHSSLLIPPPTLHFPLSTPN